METDFASTNLIAEMQRYLAAVDAFRAEGCDPHWSAEHPPAAEEGAVDSSIPFTGSWLERG